MFQQKRYLDAEQAYARALKLWEMILKPDSPLLATSLESLAVAVASQYRYAEAEPYYKRALEIREKHAAASMNYVALVAVAQDKYAEAEPLFGLALSVLERPRPQSAVDSERDTLLSAVLENYADLLERSERKAAAQKMKLRLKAVREHVAGSQPAKPAKTAKP